MAAVKEITEPGQSARLRAALQVCLALLQDISRLSGKWSSMLTFELEQTCREMAGACKHCCLPV